MRTRPKQTDTSPSISRRQMLGTVGAGLAGVLLAGCGDSGDDAGSAHTTSATDATSASTAGSANPPSCVLTREEIEGPFYTDLDLVRRDITDGKPGSPLELRLLVVDAETCQPIPDATVDIWHADGEGLYSAFTGQGDNADIDTTAESFLRGVQPTDSDGLATFSTIYPGWYRGRTTHIHVKVHFNDNTRVTTQLYFPDDVTATVYGTDTYAARGQKDTSNGDDDFSASSPALQMTVTAEGDGHIASHTLGINRA